MAATHWFITTGDFKDVADAIETIEVTTLDYAGIDTYDTSTDVKLYLLSTQETNALPPAVRVSSYGYWLRSPGENDAKAAYVTGSSGEVNVPGSIVPNWFDVRPALKLNLSSVMFESQSKTFLVKVPVTDVSLNKSEVTLNVGDAETLTATIEPTYTETTGADQTVTWSSSDEGVATVKDGVVTGVKAGTAYTGAISGWRSAKAKQPGPYMLKRYLVPM